MSNVLTLHVFLFVEGVECFSGNMCCHPECRRLGTGDAFLCASAAQSQNHVAFVSKHTENEFRDKKMIPE